MSNCTLPEPPPKKSTMLDSNHCTKEWIVNEENVCASKENPEYRQEKFEDGETAHVSCTFERTLGEKSQHADKHFCAHLETLHESVKNLPANKNLSLYIHNARLEEKSKERFLEYYRERREGHKFHDEEETNQAPPPVLTKSQYFGDEIGYRDDYLAIGYGAQVTQLDEYFRGHDEITWEDLEGFEVPHPHIAKSRRQRREYAPSPIELVLREYQTYDPSVPIEARIHTSIVSRIRPLLQQENINLSASDDYAILQACRFGNAELVKLLLKWEGPVEHRANPGARNNEPIILASQYGHADVVTLLLADDRVDPGAQNNLAFQIVSAEGNTDILTLLLADRRVDPSANNNTAIWLASYHGEVEAVKLLLADDRVNPAAQNNAAFIRASENGRTDVVKLLLADHRVDPAAQNDAAFRLASRYGRTDVVKLLLADRRVDPSAQNNAAFRLAYNNGHTDVVKLLRGSIVSTPSTT